MGTLLTDVFGPDWYDPDFEGRCASPSVLEDVFGLTEEFVEAEAAVLIERAQQWADDRLDDGYTPWGNAAAAVLEEV